MSIRQERVQAQLLDILSEMIRKDLRDPRIGFVTLTGAEVTEDLRHAKVYISVIGDEDALKQSLKALNGAVGIMRGEVARRARLRLAPEIVFLHDIGIARGQRIQAILSGLNIAPEETPTVPVEESAEKA